MALRLQAFPWSSDVPQARCLHLALVLRGGELSTLGHVLLQDGGASLRVWHRRGQDPGGGKQQRLSGLHVCGDSYQGTGDT